MKHHLPLKLRQLAPLALLSVVAADVLAPAFPLLAVPSGLYLGACLSWGAMTAVKRRDAALLMMGPASITMHLSWAIGFLGALPRGFPRARDGRWGAVSQQLNPPRRRQEAPQIDA